MGAIGNGALTQDELKKFNTYKDPDAIADYAKFKQDDLYQQILFVGLCTNLDLFLAVRQFIKPGYFSNAEHVIGVRKLYSYYEKYNHLPQTEILISDCLLEHEDDARKLACHATLLDAFHHGQPEQYSLPRLVDDATKFGKMQSIKTALHHFANEAKEHPDKIDSINTDLQNKLSDISKLSGNKSPKLRPASELFALRDTEYRWLIEGRLMAGRLTLLTAPSKAGKTVFSLHTCVSMIYDQQVWGQKVSKCPILYLDYENDTAYEKYNLDHAIVDRGYEQLDKYFFINNREETEPEYKLPDYLTLEYCQKLVEQYEEPGVIFVDTVRGAFGQIPDLPPRWEDDQSQIGKILRPFADWCHQSKWAMVFSHHTNKSGGISGTTEFKAASDILWSFEPLINVDGTDTYQRKLVITGRLPACETVILQYEDERYEFLGNGGAVQAKQRAEAEKDVIAKTFDILKSKHHTKQDLLELVKATGLRIGRDRFYELLRQLQDRSILLVEKKLLRLADNWKELHELQS